MQSRAIVVLKFGSSILSGPEAFPAVVHEIYRHIRRGERVVSDEPNPYHLAALLGLGEQQSALLLALALALARAGLKAASLGPAALSLTSTGEPLDAAPDGLDVQAIRAALRETQVATVPGFVALALNVTERQRIVLLLLKEMLVGDDTIVIRHSIPRPADPSDDGPPPSPPNPREAPSSKGYLLRFGE